MFIPGAVIEHEKGIKNHNPQNKFEAPLPSSLAPDSKSISIPKEMDCDIVLEQREKIDLVPVSKRASNTQAYRLVPGKKVELHLKHL